MRPRTVARACSILALAAMLPMGPARADPAATPFATPQHDVDVDYAIPVPAASGPAAVVTQRLRVQAASGRQRIDPPSSGAYMLTDGRSGRTTVVEPSLKLATLLPQAGQAIPPPGVRATGDYHRLDSMRIAGEPCTNWQTRDLSGQDTEVCLTDDGVLLRIVQGGQVRAEALRIGRAPQPDGVFAVPDGFRLVQAPSTGPAGQRRG